MINAFSEIGRAAEPPVVKTVSIFLRDSPACVEVSSLKSRLELFISLT